MNYRLAPMLRSLAGLFVIAFLASINIAATPSPEADVQKVTDDVKQLVKQADKLIKRGDYSGAEVLLKRAVEVRPKDSSIKLKLAHAYVKMRRLVEAYELCVPIARDEPENARAFAVVGEMLLTAGHFEEARPIFLTAIKLDKEEARAWAGIGLLDFYENRIGESLRNLHMAVYYERTEPDYLFSLAQVASRAERYHEAAQAYEDFLRYSRNADDDRRDRIKGLINFLRFLGERQSLYQTSGADSTEVPFQLVGNRPIISVRVNGRPEPLNFVLDTGSGISVISEETAKALNVRAVTKGGYAKGIGGNGKFPIVYGFMREIALGDIVVRSVPVYIRKFHSQTKIDGYIGLALISKFLTTVDYGNHKFILEKKDSVREPDAANSVSVPLRLTSSGFLSGKVLLEGIEEPLNFIVDTGASVSVISHDIATRDALAPHVRDERMRVIGSAGVAEDVASFMLPKVTMGAHSRKSITAVALDLDLINEASGFEQAGILGGNFLVNYRMTFDFQNSKVTFVSVKKEP